jgi:hypothetical protein
MVRVFSLAGANGVHNGAAMSAYVGHARAPSGPGQALLTAEKAASKRETELLDARRARKAIDSDLEVRPRPPAAGRPTVSTT